MNRDVTVVDVETDPLSEALEPPQAPPQKPEDTDWGALSRLQDKQQTAAVGNVLRQVSTANPDSKAQAIKLAEQFQIPVEWVERRLDDYKKLALEKQPETEDLVGRAPKLAEWITSDIHRAGLLRDQVPAAIELENKISWYAGIYRGGFDVNALAGRFLQQLGDTLPAPLTIPLLGAPVTIVPEVLQRAGREHAEFSEAWSASLGGRTNFEDVHNLPSFIQWAQEGLTTQLPVLGVMAAGGAAGGAIAVAGGASATIGSMLGVFVPSLVAGVGEVRGNLAQLDPNAEGGWEAWVGGSAIAALDALSWEMVIGSKLVRLFGQEAAEEVAKRALLAPVKAKLSVDHRQRRRQGHGLGRRHRSHPGGDRRGGGGGRRGPGGRLGPGLDVDEGGRRAGRAARRADGRRRHGPGDALRAGPLRGRDADQGLLRGGRRRRQGHAADGARPGGLPGALRAPDSRTGPSRTSTCRSTRSASTSRGRTSAPRSSLRSSRATPRPSSRRRGGRGPARHPDGRLRGDGWLLPSTTRSS